MIVCTVYLYIATFGTNVRFCRCGGACQSAPVLGFGWPGRFLTIAARPADDVVVMPVIG
jgi:hypothetical protein